MLTYDPALRITPTEALAHPFFSETLDAVSVNVPPAAVASPKVALAQLLIPEHSANPVVVAADLRPAHILALTQNLNRALVRFAELQKTAQMQAAQFNAETVQPIVIRPISVRPAAMDVDSPILPTVATVSAVTTSTAVLHSSKVGRTPMFPYHARHRHFRVQTAPTETVASTDGSSQQRLHPQRQRLRRAYKVTRHRLLRLAAASVTGGAGRAISVNTGAVHSVANHSTVSMARRLVLVK